MNINPAVNLLEKNQTVQTTIDIGSISTTGIYSIKLVLPRGFSGNTGPWTVNLSPGKTEKITTNITAPTTGEGYSLYTVRSVATVQQGVSEDYYSELQFTVK